jgi:hypothetical protein
MRRHRIDHFQNNEALIMKLIRYAEIGLLTVAGFALVAPAPTWAQRPTIAIGVKASTLGFGGELTLGINKRIALRAGGNLYKHDFDVTVEDIDYSMGFDWKSGMTVLDFHPFGNAFRLTGGAVWNGNKLSLTADPSTSVDIGNQTYTAAEIGTLSGAIDFNKVAPYLGFGLATQGRVGFTFDLGAAVQGSPKVTYTGTTTLTGPAQTTFNQNVAAETAEIQQDLDGRSYLKYYPVLAVGLQVKF